jgi:ubiquinone/menaquinone biosynthesis C-methylase UbiE
MNGGNEPMVTQTTTQTNVTPQRIIEDLWAGWRAQALVAGIELDLFTHIAAGEHTVQEIASSVSASEHGTQRLLDTLVALGYLNKEGNRYGLEPISETFLIRDKGPYIGGMAYTTKLTWEMWSKLTDVVKSGRSIDSVDTEGVGREFFPKLVASIFPMSFGAACAAVAALPEKTRNRIKSILDVAAGSGVWSIAFAQAIPNAHVTVIDFPEVTPITRQFAERFGLKNRYDYIEGNMRDVNFGSERYDLVILGHIIHSEGEEWGKKLIKKSYGALKDGGLLLIAEMVPNDVRTGPVIPLLFGLNMLLHTENGDVFTMREYHEWLKEAGFKDVTTIEAPAPSPLILATK